MAHARGEVDGGASPVDPVEEGRDRQIAAAVLGDERRRDPLPDLGRRVGRLVHALGRMAVHVDEPGGHDPAGDVDHALARVRGQARAHLDDRVAADAHVGRARGRAGAVHEPPVPDEQTRRPVAARARPRTRATTRRQRRSMI